MLNPSRMIQKKKKIKLPATAQVSGKTKIQTAGLNLENRNQKLFAGTT